MGDGVAFPGHQPHETHAGCVRRKLPQGYCFRPGGDAAAIHAGIEFHQYPYLNTGGGGGLAQLAHIDLAVHCHLDVRLAAQIPNLGICYDTGHGELEGAADAIHLDDNAGEGDLHLLPFDGTRNWPGLIEQLAVSAYDGPLILEANDVSLDKAIDCRSRLRDLVDEARSSLEEFRLKHKLPEPRQEDDE